MTGTDAFVPAQQQMAQFVMTRNGRDVANELGPTTGLWVAPDTSWIVDSPRFDRRIAALECPAVGGVESNLPIRTTVSSPSQSRPG